MPRRPRSRRPRSLRSTHPSRRRHRSRRSAARRAPTRPEVGGPPSVAGLAAVSGGPLAAVQPFGAPAGPSDGRDRDMTPGGARRSSDGAAAEPNRAWSGRRTGSRLVSFIRWCHDGTVDVSIPCRSSPGHGRAPFAQGERMSDVRIWSEPEAAVPRSMSAAGGRSMTNLPLPRAPDCRARCVRSLRADAAGSSPAPSATRLASWHSRRLAACRA